MNRKTSDSLRGQNRGRRAAGAGSSPARSILWRRLRECDRRITELDWLIQVETCAERFRSSKSNKLKKQREACDAKRKAIRMSMKHHEP